MGPLCRRKYQQPGFLSSHKHNLSGLLATVAAKWRNNHNGFQLLASRQTSPDLLCFGFIGCLAVPGVPRSKLPVSQQLTGAVKEHLEPIMNVRDIQKAWVHEADKSVSYFYRNGPETKQDLYGMCTSTPKYLACDYLFSDGNFFYNIHILSNNAASASEWQLDKRIFRLSRTVLSSCSIPLVAQMALHATLKQTTETEAGSRSTLSSAWG